MNNEDVTLCNNVPIAGIGKLYKTYFEVWILFTFHISKGNGEIIMIVLLLIV